LKEILTFFTLLGQKSKKHIFTPQAAIKYQKQELYSHKSIRSHGLYF